MDVMTEQENALVGKLLSGNGTSITQTMSGRETVLQKISLSSAAPGEPVAVAIATSTGERVEVGIPISALAALGGDVVMVASVFNTSQAASLFAESGESQSAVKTELKAVFNLNIRDMSGQKMVVSDLAEPILLTMSANFTPGMTCAYWDETAAEWSTAGVTMVNTGEGPLVCATIHLSFFGAIVRGMLKSLMCSQASLFSKESYGALVQGDWFYDVGAILLWLLLIFLFGIIVAALYIDHMGGKNWSDDMFLIAMKHPPEKEEEDMRQEGLEELKKTGCLLITTSIAVIVEVSWSALRDVIDEIGSQFCSTFSEIRTFIDGLQASLGDFASSEVVLTGGESRRAALVASWAVGLAGSTSTRLVATSMWFSLDDGDLIQEGIDMQAGEDTETPADTERHKTRMQFLKTFQNSHEAHNDTHHGKLTSWLTLPRMAGSIFLSQTPVGSVFLRSISISCGLRALFLTCELLGALALGTFFASATGPSRSKARPAPDDGECSMSGIGEMIGRLMIIGVLSAVVAALPVGLLSKVHTRSFIKVDHEGCDEWKRRLRKWRMHDRFIWVCGILYAAFCAHFIMLFFASVVADDQMGWIVSGLISLSQDLMIVPLASALAFPFISMTFLSAAALYHKSNKHTLLARRKSSAEVGAEDNVQADMDDCNWVADQVDECVGIRALPRISPRFDEVTI